jgi:hypothetical protein
MERNGVPVRFILVLGVEYAALVRHPLSEQCLPMSTVSCKVLHDFLHRSDACTRQWPPLCRKMANDIVNDVA